MTVSCPDCGMPAKRVGWRPLDNGRVKEFYSCNNGSCLRSRLNFSRTTLLMEAET